MLPHVPVQVNRIQTRDLPRHARGRGHGPDIDTVHRHIFGGTPAKQERLRYLYEWLSAHQPCVFGRLAARGNGAGPKGLQMDCCLLDEVDLAAGEDRVASIVEDARTAWKDRALQGLSSGFLVWIVDEQLAGARPSVELGRATAGFAGLCFPEFAPVRPDFVYTEAVPLRRPGSGVGLFKASIQLFLTAAHLHANHDRRFPGGIAFVVNAPGHYAASAVQHGHFRDHPSAVRFVQRGAARSIGNGGIGHPDGKSSSWHTAVRPPGSPGEEPVRPWLFSATHQVDVLISSHLMTSAAASQTWDGLHLDYISDGQVDETSPDFGWFRPLPVTAAHRYDVPWKPQAAFNSASFDY